MNKTRNTLHGFLALSPLAVFLLLYLLSSLIAGDFYKVPLSSAFLLACIYGIAIFRFQPNVSSPQQPTFSQRLEIFARGAGHKDIMVMVCIFLLAGAFAGTAKSIGSIDATVAATLHIVPPKALFAGLFITACFISMAIGTSVGTIVALVPLASGIAHECEQNVPYMTAIVVGGAFFGDNLSFISDTTIAATRAMGVRMKDKFLANLRIVFPAFVIVLSCYLWQGWNLQLTPHVEEANYWLILPYMLVIVLACAGVNVILTLSLGLFSGALGGFLTEAFDWMGWLSSMGEGIASVQELVIVTLMAGGLMELIKESGGLEFLIRTIYSHAKQERGAYLSIALMVSVANLCTANNTIAILTTGKIAHDISERFHLDPRRTASVLDTFSCFVQGIIPYGAQLLIAAGLAEITSTAIIPHLYYPFLLGISAFLFTLFFTSHNAGNEDCQNSSRRDKTYYKDE